MNPEPDAILIGVAEAVADGVPVDWQGLLAARPEMVRELELLRLYERILVAHRDAVRLDEPPESSRQRPAG